MSSNLGEAFLHRIRVYFLAGYCSVGWLMDPLLFCRVADGSLSGLELVGQEPFHIFATQEGILEIE